MDLQTLQLKKKLLKIMLENVGIYDVVRNSWEAIHTKHNVP